MAAALILVFACAIPAAADPVTYVYTGNDFTNFYGPTYENAQSFISAYFTFAEPLSPGTADDDTLLTWGATSQPQFGNYDLDGQGGNLSLYLVIGADGLPVSWSFTVTPDPQDPWFSYASTDVPGNVIDFSSIGETRTTEAYNQNDPGTWSCETCGSAVPEPATMTLLFVGLAAGALKRRGAKPARG